MLKFVASLAAVPFALLLSTTANAQDTMSEDLPAACQTETGDMAPAMSESGMAMGQMAEMDEAHTALMQGMDEMNQNMMMGAMAPDIDLAFACAMIPHHQGAIDMAEAELKYGKDEWTRQTAQMVIDAQTKEIADLKKWIEERGN